MLLRSSASDLLPRTATNAILALNAAERVQRGTLLIFAPVLAGDILVLRCSVPLIGLFRFAGQTLCQPLIGRVG